MVRNDLASRQHLSVQFSRGRCTITDNSTNGTVIFANKDKTGHELKRDSFTLIGSGTIVLGRPSEVNETDTVRYESV